MQNEEKSWLTIFCEENETRKNFSDSLRFLLSNKMISNVFLLDEKNILDKEKGGFRSFHSIVEQKKEYDNILEAFDFICPEVVDRDLCEVSFSSVKELLGFIDLESCPQNKFFSFSLLSSPPCNNNQNSSETGDHYKKIETCTKKVYLNISSCRSPIFLLKNKSGDSNSNSNTKTTLSQKRQILEKEFFVNFFFQQSDCDAMMLTSGLLNGSSGSSSSKGYQSYNHWGGIGLEIESRYEMVHLLKLSLSRLASLELNKRTFATNFLVKMNKPWKISEFSVKRRARHNDVLGTIKRSLSFSFGGGGEGQQEQKDESYPYFFSSQDIVGLSSHIIYLWPPIFSFALNPDQIREFGCFPQFCISFDVFQCN